MAAKNGNGSLLSLNSETAREDLMVSLFEGIDTVDKGALDYIYCRLDIALAVLRTATWEACEKNENGIAGCLYAVEDQLVEAQAVTLRVLGTLAKPADAAA